MVDGPEIRRDAMSRGLGSDITFRERLNLMVSKNYIDWCQVDCYDQKDTVKVHTPTSIDFYIWFNMTRTKFYDLPVNCDVAY